MPDQNLDINSSPTEQSTREQSVQTLEEIRKIHGSIIRQLIETRRSINGWLCGMLVVGIVIACILYASMWLEYGSKLCRSCKVLSAQANCQICKGTGFTLYRPFSYPVYPSPHMGIMIGMGVGGCIAGITKMLEPPVAPHCTYCVSDDQ